MSTVAHREPLVASTGPQTPSRRLANLAFATMLGIYFFSFFQRSAIPGTIFNELQQEWNLSASAIVALGSIFLWVYAVMQLVVGILADRFGGTRTLLVGGVIMSVGSVLFPLSPSPALLYASRTITAVGGSFVYLCIVKEVSLLFDHRRFAKLVGFVQFIGPLGGMMAMLPFERATHFFGWRHSLLAVAFATSAVVGVNFLILPKLNHFVPHTTKFSLRPVLDILRNRRNWPMFLCASINFPVYFVIQIGIGKKFIQDFVGLGSSQAATFTFIMMITAAIVSLLSGFLLQHTGGRRKPYLFLSVSLLLGALLLLLAGIFFHLGAGVFLTGYILLAIANVASPIGVTVMKELNDSRHIGQALALLNTMTYCGVALGLTLCGTVMDLHKTSALKTQAGPIIYPAAAYGTVFAIFAGLTVVSLISTSFIHETQHSPVETADLAEPPETF